MIIAASLITESMTEIVFFHSVGVILIGIIFHFLQHGSTFSECCKCSAKFFSTSFFPVPRYTVGMDHKFKFIGGHQDGNELPIEGVVPQEMRIPLHAEPTKAEVYVLHGDGCYHFDRFSDAPPHHEDRE